MKKTEFWKLYDRMQELNRRLGYGNLSRDKCITKEGGGVKC